MSRAGRGPAPVDEDATVLFAAASPVFSIAAAYFHEVLATLARPGAAPRFLVRYYGRVLNEVDASFVRDLLLLRPRLVAFSSFFWNLEENVRLARLAKELAPDVVNVLGGPQVGDLADALALAQREPALDAIFCGEADLSFPEFALATCRGEQPGPPPGAVVRRNGALVAGDASCAVTDLSRLPPIFHSGNAYLASCLSAGVVPMQTLRGCRNQCSYCLYGVPRLRFFPLARVEEEVAFLCTRRARRVRIGDSHFGGTRDRAMEIFDLIRRHNEETEFSFYPDPEHVDERYLAAARDANCVPISLGVETLDPAAAAAVHRRLDRAAVSRVLGALAANGQHPQVDLMIGLPEQSARSVADDAAFLRERGVRRVLFSPLMVFPGTPLHQEAGARALVVLPTPQGFAYPAATGLAGYAEALLVAEAQQVLSVLWRTDGYLRSRGVPPPSADVCRQGARRALLDLAERLRCSGRDLRAQVALVADGAARFLRAWFGAAVPRDLGELVELDLQEEAMLRRSAELKRDSGAPGGTQVLFAEDLAHVRWALHEEAWLETFRLPPDARYDGHRAARTDRTLRYVFACGSGVMYEVDEAELALLQGFRSPGLLPPDGPRRGLVKRWAHRGVLAPVDPRATTTFSSEKAASRAIVGHNWTGGVGLAAEVLL